MKNIFYIFSGIFLFLMSCAPSQEQQNTIEDDYEPETEKVQQKKCIYSLFFDNTKNNYQLYRNNEKYAIFSTARGMNPIAIDAFSGDCYILVSGQKSDTLPPVSEILKNGRQAIVFGEGFSAKDFCIRKGHFYAVGCFGDSVITVFKDGLRCLTVERNGKTPVKISVNNENIFWAAEKGGKTEIYRNEELLYSIEGKCSNFEVADCGIHAMISGKIYCDGKIFMEGGNSYKFLNNDLTASPVCFSLSDRTCYTGVSSKLESNGHLLAGVFKYRDPFVTVKPDDKVLGKSDYQTECCAISATGNGVYFVTINFRTPERKQNIFHYYFDTEEFFSIETAGDYVKLLFVKGC
ncbi:MAG: hypothetical protein IIU03_13395 [Bacteroidales bacterium]|nr:hypothetical protein [Bacteroidales bacterium]